MENWYLAQCQNKSFDRVLRWISSLNVECYFPLETRITRRKDCGGSRVSQKPLLPGYLFVCFDPEVTHPTKITDIPGVHSFVRFGDMPCIIRDEVIKALKCVRILRIDPTDNCVECANLSPALISAIQRIYAIPRPLERQVEFMRLLERSDVLEELLSDTSHIYTAVTGISSSGGCEANLPHPATVYSDVNAEKILRERIASRSLQRPSLT